MLNSTCKNQTANSFHYTFTLNLSTKDIPGIISLPLKYYTMLHPFPSWHNIKLNVCEQKLFLHSHSS